MADVASLSSYIATFPLKLASLNTLKLLPKPPVVACVPADSCGVQAPTVSIVSEQHQELQPVRRRILLTFAVACFVEGFTAFGTRTRDANAFSFGISGPKEWLKAQKRKASKFLLAPISASRDRLNEAILLLTQNDSENGYLEAKNLVEVAARDCKPAGQGSFASFQASTGVEVCTFRLILKNAASLLDDADPIKLKAEVSLRNLINSFVALDKLLMNDNQDSFFGRDSISIAFKNVLGTLDNFEECIFDCLEA